MKEGFPSVRDYQKSTSALINITIFITQPPDHIYIYLPYI